MRGPTLWRSRSLQPLKPYVCGDCVSKLGLRRSSQNAVAGSNDALKSWDEQAQKTRAGDRKSLLTILEERGYVKDLAGDRSALDKLLTDKRIGAYSGIDPTAPSLHLGHLLPMMVLFWMYIHGHKAVSIIGGATAKIGDPTGRLVSRQDMDRNTRSSNLVSLHNCVRGMWKSVERYAERHGYPKDKAWSKSIQNNSVWLGKLNIIDFLSDAGTVARMGAMLGRDTVKNKMAQGDGMSYAEFTYPLLQAYDWWHLYQSGVQVQIGGSDQYGNIVAGIDLIKHLTPRPSTSPETKQLSGPFGLTVPLLTTAAGAKFGKSAGNAIWLDKTMTSPFELYGFLVRSADADVERYLKLFTFLPLEHIAAVMTEHEADPSQRKAQHLLAREVVDLVHGTEEAQNTQNQHTFSRRPNLQSLQAEAENSKDSLNRLYLPQSLVQGKQPARILYHAGLAKSNSDGTRMVNSGGAYIGSQTSEQEAATEGELKFRSLKGVTSSVITEMVEKSNVLVLRTGKWNVKLVEVISDAEFEQKGLSAPGWEEFKGARDASSS
ncbi:tyrosyl-tRNA synthetase [Aureobasidium pullulans]|uniref:Tyrosine--tRNA ligase n=1 Tax=Aureobasidium pullulans TaxID=5580 RepID=A0A4V4LCK7_AURPU|nr:tyrosyl-tRNA synthetase [Aureobasidium pullulans]